MLSHGEEFATYPGYREGRVARNRGACIPELKYLSQGSRWEIADGQNPYSLTVKEAAPDCWLEQEVSRLK